MEIVDNYGNEIISKCQEIDKQSKGEVSITEFFEIFKQMGIKTTAKLENYMKLLFYSHDCKLDSVPYEHFINAFKKDDLPSASSKNDEDRAKIVRGYLSQIATAVLQKNLSLRQVFKIDERDRIHPQSFQEGVNLLELDIDSYNIMLILECLHCDDEEYLCISMEELEDIMVYYGVPIPEDNHLRTGSNVGQKVNLQNPQQKETVKNVSKQSSSSLQDQRPASGKILSSGSSVKIQGDQSDDELDLTTYRENEEDYEEGDFEDVGNYVSDSLDFAHEDKSSIKAPSQNQENGVLGKLDLNQPEKEKSVPYQSASEPPLSSKRLSEASSAAQFNGISLESKRGRSPSIIDQGLSSISDRGNQDDVSAKQESMEISQRSWDINQKIKSDDNYNESQKAKECLDPEGSMEFDQYSENNSDNEEKDQFMSEEESSEYKKFSSQSSDDDLQECAQQISNILEQADYQVEEQQRQSQGEQEQSEILSQGQESNQDDIKEGHRDLDNDNKMQLGSQIQQEIDQISNDSKNQERLVEVREDNYDFDIKNASISSQESQEEQFSEQNSFQSSKNKSSQSSQNKSSKSSMKKSSQSSRSKYSRKSSDNESDDVVDQQVDQIFEANSAILTSKKQENDNQPDLQITTPTKVIKKKAKPQLVESSADSGLSYIPDKTNPQPLIPQPPNYQNSDTKVLNKARKLKEAPITEEQLSHQQEPLNIHSELSQQSESFNSPQSQLMQSKGTDFTFAKSQRNTNLDIIMNSSSSDVISDIENEISEAEETHLDFIESSIAISQTPAEIPIQGQVAPAIWSISSGKATPV